MRDRVHKIRIRGGGSLGTVTVTARGRGTEMACRRVILSAGLDHVKRENYIIWKKQRGARTALPRNSQRYEAWERIST